MKKKLFLLASIVLMNQIAMAESVTGSHKATATLSSACQISAQNLSFGQYNPASGDSFASSNLTFICTKGTNATIGIAANNKVQITNKYVYAESGLTYARYMANGGNSLYYNLFQDSGFTKVFGGSNWFIFTGNARPTFVATGISQTVPIYAALSGGQYVVPGVYSENLSVSITY